MNEDSLDKRYVSRVVSGLIKLLLGIATIGIVPRALGPVAYGNFNFLTTFFNTALKFLKFGIGSAFYSKLSKRQHEKNLIGTYIIYVLLIITFLSLLTIGSIKFGFKEIIWPDQKIIIIYAALLYSLLTIVSELNQVTLDALGHTVSFEKINILRSIFFTTLIITFYYSNNLSIYSYFLINYFLLTFIILASWLILKKNNINLIKQIFMTKNKFINYMKEFVNYSHPLFINGLIVFIVAISDRWFLQVFSGSEQQGYYSIGFKLSSTFFLFTGSISSLLLREMSSSYKSKDKAKIKYYMKQYVPVFYFIAAYFGIFLSLNSEILTVLIGGEKYINASVAVSILALYPVHQTYGQLGGAVFEATEQTNIIRNVGVSTGVIGIMLAFLFIGPSKYYGLELGAIGLALKVVIVQFFYVNILLFISTRFLELSFKKFLYHQFLVIIIFIILATLSKNISLFFIKDQLIVNFLVAGFFYTILTVFSVLLYPGLIILKRHELIDKIKTTYNFLDSRRKKWQK